MKVLNNIILLAQDINVVKPVSTEEFTARILKFFKEIGKMLDAIIIPLAVIFCLFSIVLIIVGTSSQSSSMKKTGTKFLLFEFAGVLLYLCLPLIMGLLKYLSSILNGVR